MTKVKLKSILLKILILNVQFHSKMFHLTLLKWCSCTMYFFPCYRSTFHAHHSTWSCFKSLIALFVWKWCRCVSKIFVSFESNEINKQFVFFSYFRWKSNIKRKNIPLSLLWWLKYLIDSVSSIAKTNESKNMKKIESFGKCL